MGWWSAEIMGGDTPLDLESMWDDAEVKNEAQAVEFAERWSGWGEDVVWEVTGWLMMKNGIPISKETADSIINAATEDEWASEGSQERQEVIDSYIDLVRAYSLGEQVSLPTPKGLFDVIAEKMNEN